MNKTSFDTCDVANSFIYNDIQCISYWWFIVVADLRAFSLKKPTLFTFLHKSKKVLWKKQWKVLHFTCVMRFTCTFSKKFWFFIYVSYKFKTEITEFQWNQRMLKHCPPPFFFSKILSCLTCENSIKHNQVWQIWS